MLKYSASSTNDFKLAGCISLENKPSIFGFQWHDSLIPLANDYTALERAVFECACAGCESIWITVNDDWSPLIKHRLGDFVYDPVWYFRAHDTHSRDGRKIIPIFYVPHLPKYRDKRDSQGWGIINAAIYAETVTRTMSDLLSPNMFYAAFPLGVFNPRELLKQRKIISSSSRVFLRHANKTIKDGERLSFTFTWEDLREVNRHISENGTGLYKSIGKFVKGDNRAWSRRLPKEEQYSATKFNLGEVFHPMKEKEGNIIDLSWHYDISSWDNYKKFMGSEKTMNKPAPLKQQEILHPVGVDSE